MTRRFLRGFAVASASSYDAECRRCPRLAAFLDAVRAEHPHYHCRPVPSFGAAAARLVVVGLAPGMHGANATGRPFTGDHAGILLYATLFKFGFATRPDARAVDDGLRLIDARITNAVKCLPPGNKPQPAEIRQCNAYLTAELSTLPAGAAVLALGRIAHDAALRALGLPLRGHVFGHGAEHIIGRGARLVAGRLTTAMFEQVFAAITRHLARERTAAGVA
ncbi:MAG: SPO1 DNA polymerase [Betaproteobacteria bacterium 13_1_40CM_4_64_4]|nr:MAG: SPO1 DNA polymerase [Betaproteobacteria bacterium 13_1_40CM_4_64_4]